MIEVILDQCLEDIRQKRATVAECLAKYPQYADELAPLLHVASRVQTAPDVKPSLAFKLKTRAQIAEWSSPTSKPAWFENILPRFSFATVAALFLVILGLGGGMVHASSDSLPGSPLYSVKRATESVQLALATDPSTQAQLHMIFAERRLIEAKSLAATSTTLTEDTLDEYNREVDEAVAAVPVGQQSLPLNQELTNRLNNQQKDLKSLESKVPESKLGKSVDASEKAKDVLKKK